MDACEVVVHVVERDGRFVVLDLLGETVGQPREPAHTHPHGEVLPLHVARTDELFFGLAKADDLLAAVADRRAVAFLPFRGIAEVLHELRVINLIGEGVDHSIQIDLVAVRRELHAVGEAPLQVGNEFGGAAGISRAHQPAGNEFGVGIDGNPYPGVADDPLLGHLFRDALLLAANETPDLVALQPLAFQVAQNAILVAVAGGTDFDQQARHSALLAAQHAADGADRIAFNQGGKDLGSFIDAQAVHTSIMRVRSRIVKIFFTNGAIIRTKMAGTTAAPFDVDFGIEIEFKPNTPDPARVYRSMTALIEACQSIDIDLAGSINPRIRPVLFLENIQTGSLTTFLRSALESVDDDALKGLEWKKLVGAYLVRAKRIMVNYLEDRETIQGSPEIYDLQAVIADAAAQTGAVRVPEYKALPVAKVANAVRLISDGTTPLGPDDQATYLSPEGSVGINKSFRVTSERIEEVLTQTTIVTPRDMILKVKKPDFLGDSMWDFRWDGKKLPAKVLDSGWLAEFHRGNVTLHPGDALDVAVEEIVKYGYDQEVLATHYKINLVRRIISRSE